MHSKHMNIAEIQLDILKTKTMDSHYGHLFAYLAVLRLAFYFLHIFRVGLFLGEQTGKNSCDELM